jgi:sigma-B regulation protein RsbU (phosphoserine phosphatase)
MAVAVMQVRSPKQRSLAMQATAAHQHSTLVPFRSAGVMAMVAHDLRNPLNSVVMSARTFSRDAALPADVRRGLAQIERAAWRMNELIEKMLDFSAAHFGGSLPISPVATDLREVTELALDELRNAMPDRRITLVSVGNAHGLWDPARLTQVVSNLVGNALTHGGSSSPVEVRVDASGGDVSLSVRNYGPVIPAELMPTLFEPFRRGGAQDHRVRGLGLGLYIAQQVVSAHGGTIDVDSTEEDGTVFTVRLPRSWSRP